MERLSIVMDKETKQLLDDWATKRALKRSSAIRLIIREKLGDNK